jgi:hypothetical protein
LAAAIPTAAGTPSAEAAIPSAAADIPSAAADIPLAEATVVAGTAAGMEAADITGRV